MQSYKVFVSDPKRNYDILSNNPMNLTKKMALEEFDNISGCAKCFIGFIDDHSGTIQFYWEADGSVTIDVPIPEQKGSLMKSSTAKECRDFIVHHDNQSFKNIVPGLVLEKYQK